MRIEKKFSADFGVEGKSGNMEQILIPPIKNIRQHLNIMMNMYSDISLYMKLVIISIAVLMLYALFKDK